jgi:hypothetical protein
MAHSSIAADRTETAGAASERPPPGLVLASEALREDLAPIEPGRGSGRVVTGGVALALVLLGVAMRQGVGPVAPENTSSSIAFAAAGIAVALACLPFSYTVRAVAVALLGGALMALGVVAAGPLASLRLGSTLGVELTRLLALAALPGALLFRARYRAYPRARLVLGVALLAALPFAIGRAGVFLDSASDLVDRAGAAVDVAVILSGLFGFMGADTTAGGAVWAALVLGVLSADIALRELDAPAGLTHWMAHSATAIGAACAGILAAMGEYHLLAAGLGRDARRMAKKRAQDVSPA